MIGLLMTLYGKKIKYIFTIQSIQIHISNKGVLL